MISKDEQVRATIAEQASEWFVANDEGPLDAKQSAALVAWLKGSPVHIEEFLGVSVIARDLREACADPEQSLNTLIAQARAEDDNRILPSSWARIIAAVRDTLAFRWQTAAVTIAAVGVLCLGLLLWWNSRPIAQGSTPSDVTVLRFETRHGEQQTHRLSDNSVLHLNTDSSMRVRLSRHERLVELSAGEADFEVAHGSDRPFRVLAGSAEVVDLGTRFDVRLNQQSTVVTVVEGRVAVRLSSRSAQGGANPGPGRAAPTVQLGANQQIMVAEGDWPAAPVAVDAQRSTAWLHRQISFNHEPLERVAREFNRYSRTPIEITTPALRRLEISGVFSIDDTDGFIAFLRSLEGVHVEVSATRIRVSQD